ncbi:uncharacterized protein LOC119769646 [Culex quinquefasciatus]|uniref:uncharacterized protein LOC119769646 n=1 Tax=Culex quinquefasciatus TaxID=7176 RepID=UPI0018E3EC85|nr:uncharacterized protein LOC119769646 [Culex quinquefasciatus]
MIMVRRQARLDKTTPANPPFRAPAKAENPKQASSLAVARRADRSDASRWRIRRSARPTLSILIAWRQAPLDETTPANPRFRAPAKTENLKQGPPPQEQLTQATRVGGADAPPGQGHPI